MDRATIRCYIYACPPGQRYPAARALAEMGLHFEYADETSGPDVLSLTAPYFAEEHNADSTGDCAQALRTAAPGCSYMLWADPYYGGPGDVHAYTPALGTFTAACDPSGEPLLSRADVAPMLRGKGRPRWLSGLLPARRGRIAAQLDRAMGGPWMDEYAAARAAAAAGAGPGLAVHCPGATPRQYTWDEDGTPARGTLADYAAAFARANDTAFPGADLSTEVQSGGTAYPVQSEALAARPDEDGSRAIRLSVPGEEVTIRTWG